MKQRFTVKNLKDAEGKIGEKESQEGGEKEVRKGMDIKNKCPKLWHGKKTVYGVT